MLNLVPISLLWEKGRTLNVISSFWRSYTAAVGAIM
jgi:hypothetical protein